MAVVSDESGSVSLINVFPPSPEEGGSSCAHQLLLHGRGWLWPRPRRHLRSPVQDNGALLPVAVPAGSRSVTSARSGWRSGTAEESPFESGRTGRSPTFVVPLTVMVL